MKNVKTVYILGAILLGLIAFALLFEIPSEKYGQSSKEMNQYFLRDVLVDQISKIEISKGEQKTTLQKSGQIFLVKEQQNFPASPDLTKSFIEGLIDLKIGTLISSNAEKQDQFGVTADGGTRVKVFIEDDEKINFIAGNEGESGGVYIRKEGSNDVYLAKTNITADLSRNSDAWRDMTILIFDSSKVKQVVFKSGDKKAAYTKKEDGSWQKDGTDLTETTTPASSDFTDTYSELSNLKGSSIEALKNLESYNLTEGKEEIKVYIGFDDGSSKTVLISKKDQDYFTKNTEKEVIFKIGDSIVEQIKKLL
jgi:hypothetical protein